MGGGAPVAVSRIFSVALAVATVWSTIPVEACLTFETAAPRPLSISINGDSELRTNPAVKGGSGTPTDPYRIEDLTDLGRNRLLTCS